MILYYTLLGMGGSDAGPVASTATGTDPVPVIAAATSDG